MVNKIKNFKELWWLITLLFGFVIGIISLTWSISGQYNDILDKYEELVQTNKTTQQMALKSVIWNEDIPIGERAAACDVYLNAGFNSLTKKECQVIVEKATAQGVFK